MVSPFSRWKIESDARDFEFLLGSKAHPLFNAASSNSEYFASLFSGISILRKIFGVDVSHRIAQLWLIDFNQCRNVAITDDEVITVINAFFINDSCYSRPNKTDTEDQKR